MKITDKEVDEKLLKKINYLDTVVEEYNGESDRYIAYDGTKFTSKKLPTSTKKMLDEGDIFELEDNLYNPKRMFRSSLVSDMNVDSQQVCSAIKSMTKRATQVPLRSFDSNIILSRKIANSLVILLENGELKEIFRNVTDLGNFVEVIRQNFSILDFDAHDITDICQSSGEGFLISTRNNGVFLYKAGKAELKFKINGANIVRKLSNDLFLCISDSEVSIFNFRDGSRIERSAKIKNSFQRPKLVETTNDMILIWAKDFGISSSTDLLHVWKRDRAGLSYNNIDKEIAPNPEEIASYKFSCIYKNNLYFLKKKMDGYYVVKYSLSRLKESAEEIKLNENPYGEVVRFFVDEKGINLVYRRRRLVIDENQNTILNLGFCAHVTDIFFIDDKEFYIMENEVGTYEMPVSNKDENVFQFKITREQCNNIDILIKGLSEKDKITFIDAETLNDVKPMYIVAYKDELISKILNSKANSLLMRVQLNASSEIKGFVVKTNNIFLK